MPRVSPLSITACAALSPAQAEQLSLAEIQGAVDRASAEEAVRHPVALLHLARALEPGLWLSRRTQLLDEIAGRVPSADSEIGLAVAAERAVDFARTALLDPAEELARHVLARCGPDVTVTKARANEALGRVLAWRGDEISARSADRLLGEAADQYADLGLVDLAANTIFWRGNAVSFQHGDLVGAEAAMRKALDAYRPHSPRRGNALTFLADVFTMWGRWDEADAALDEAAHLAAEHHDLHTAAYVSWQRARVSSLLADAEATERHLHDAERNVADWFDITTGSTYLADAAELLDRVGRHEAADHYLRRAQRQDAHDEFVLQAEAALLARRGDPALALVALRGLNHLPWLEVRLTWRRTLLTAYASLRAGDVAAAALAARALSQAAALGDPRIALIGEPEIARAVLPLAAMAGSRDAEVLLAGDGEVTIRLLGQVSVRRLGEEVRLPVGQSAKLLRLLAVSPQGMDVEELTESLWPEAPPDVGRRRLRATLARLRSRTGDLVERTGSRLSLGPAWVDVHAFRSAADRALSANSADSEPLAAAALALWTGELLPSDPYEEWAVALREQVRRRALDLLDLVARSARDRGSFDEARRALERAIEVDPDDESRYVAAAYCLSAVGRRGPAQQMLQRAIAVLDGLGAGPTLEIRQALSELAPG